MLFSNERFTRTERLKDVELFSGHRRMDEDPLGTREIMSYMFVIFQFSSSLFTLPRWNEVVNINFLKNVHLGFI